MVFYMSARFLLKKFLYLILLIPTLLQAAVDLELDISELSPESLTTMPPVLIGKNGEKIISDINFTNEKVLLNKIPAENEARRLLTATVDKYISKSNVIINKIMNNIIEIPNQVTKSKIIHKLKLNKSFLKNIFNDLYLKKTDMANVFYVTKFNNEAVVITQAEIIGSELNIEFVMSNPDNILNTILNNEGAIKRASVENIRSIGRDVISNNPVIKKMKTYVVSSTLEANYRRLGFTEFTCL